MLIMKQDRKYCKLCGAEVTDNKAKKCANCGAKISKPIYKKWWFWVIIALGVIMIASSGGDQNGEIETSETDSSNSESQEKPLEKQYEIVDLQTMLDTLEQNALKAENVYQDKYVQIEGKIANFDSDGKYISIEPVDADEWNFETVQCYIKQESHRQFLMEKMKGDVVTIKGKIISIGELLGYSMNIEEIE